MAGELACVKSVDEAMEQSNSAYYTTALIYGNTLEFNTVYK